MTKQIILVKPDTFTTEDIKKLEANDFLVIEAENPEEINFILPTTILPSDDIVKAAIKAIADSSDTVSARFIQNINKKLNP